MGRFAIFWPNDFKLDTHVAQPNTQLLSTRIFDWGHGSRSRLPEVKNYVVNFRPLTSARSTWNFRVWLKSIWRIWWCERYSGICRQGAPLALVGVVTRACPHFVNFEMESWNLNWRYLDRFRWEHRVTFLSFDLRAEIINLELELLWQNLDFQSAAAAKSYKLAQNH
jgi:hypothetical protein